MRVDACFQHIRKYFLKIGSQYHSAPIGNIRNLLRVCLPKITVLLCLTFAIYIIPCTNSNRIYLFIYYVVLCVFPILTNMSSKLVHNSILLQLAKNKEISHTANIRYISLTPLTRKYFLGYLICAL